MITCPDCGKEIRFGERNSVCGFCGFLYVNNLKTEKRVKIPDFNQYKAVKKRLLLIEETAGVIHVSPEIQAVADFILSLDMASQIKFLRSNHDLKDIYSYADSVGCLVLSNLTREKDESYEELFLKFSEELKNFAERIYPEFKDAFKAPEYYNYSYTAGFLSRENKNYFFEAVLSCMCNLINLLSKRIRIVLVIDRADHFVDMGNEILSRVIEYCPKNLRIIAVKHETVLHAGNAEEQADFFQKCYDLNTPSEFPAACEIKSEELSRIEFSKFEYDLIKYIKKVFSTHDEKAHGFIKSAAQWSQQTGTGIIFIRILTKIHPSCIKDKKAYKEMIKSLYEDIDYEDLDKLTVRINYLEYLITHEYFEENIDEANGYLVLYSMILKNAVNYPSIDSANPELRLRQLFLDIFIIKINKKISVPANLDATLLFIIETYKKQPVKYAEWLIALSFCLSEALTLFDELYEEQKEANGYLTSFDSLSVFNDYLKKVADYSVSLFNPLLKAKADFLYAKHNYNMGKCLECLYVCNKNHSFKASEYIVIMAKACNLVLNNCLLAENPQSLNENLIITTMESLRESAVILFRLFPYKSVFDDESGAFFLAALLNRKGFYYYIREKYMSAEVWLKKCRGFIANMEERPSLTKPNYHVLFECMLTAGIVEFKRGDYAEAERLFLELEKNIKERIGFDREQGVIWYSNLYFYFKKIYEKYNGKETHSFYKFRDFKLSNEIVVNMRNALINSRLVLLYGHCDIAVVTFENLRQITAYFKDLDSGYYYNYKNICYGYLSICMENELIQKSTAASFIEKMFREIEKEDFEFFLEQEFLPFEEADAKILMDHLLSADFFE